MMTDGEEGNKASRRDINSEMAPTHPRNPPWEGKKEEKTDIIYLTCRLPKYYPR